MHAGQLGTYYNGASDDVHVVVVVVVERRDDLDPATRRRFRTGRMCLDLTHTGGDGEAARWEILHEPADAARFLGIIIETEPPTVEADDMERVVAVRQAISNMARCRVAGVAEPDGTIDVINAAAAEPSLVPQLGTDGARQLLAGSVRQALSTIARDAVDLYSSPLADRVRVCEAHDCGLLFVDASRPGRRRWCSMDWCGDRAKKRAAGRTVREGYVE